MTIRYEYKSECCGHDYVEQRAKDEAAFFTKCNKCSTGDYILVQEIKIADEIERVEVIDAPVEK